MNKTKIFMECFKIILKKFIHFFRLIYVSLIKDNGKYNSCNYSYIYFLF